METPNSIGRLQLLNYLSKKIKNIIQIYYIYGVISILLDEMIIDLKKGKKIKIKNFGIIELVQNKPRKYFDVRYQKTMLSGKNKILKFNLDPLLRKKLCKNLDIDKTFKDN